MEDIKKTYIPVGQAIKINYKSIKLNKFVKGNKVKLIIFAISLSLLICYTLLIYRFIKLLQIL